MKIVKKVKIGKSRQVGDDQIGVGGSVSENPDRQTQFYYKGSKNPSTASAVWGIYKPNSIRNEVRTSQPQALCTNVVPVLMPVPAHPL